jgi:hypothetical protein
MAIKGQRPGGPWNCTRTNPHTGQPCGAEFGTVVNGRLYIGAFEVHQISLACHLCGAPRSWYGPPPLRKKRVDVTMVTRV